MTNLRWLSLFCFLYFALIFPSTANTIYSSAILNEASSLVNIVPKQAKQLAKDYLVQRTLSSKTEHSPSVMSRDEKDSRTRTPGSTVDAMRILAQAEFNLGNHAEALLLLQKAKTIAIDYSLPYLLAEIKLVDIKLRWLIEKNTNETRQKLKQLDEEFSLIKNSKQLAQGLSYRITMFKADIASANGEIDLASKLYQSVKDYVDGTKSPQTTISYHTTIGQHLLANKKYNLALSELLMSYWMSIETDSAYQLAVVNQTLGQLFYERHVFDKANDHLSQAADFYDNYDNSPALAPILKRMGDIYYYQGKYNLALVHYFNAMDHERMQNNIESVIDIRISLATTYLNLINYPLAEQYLERAQELLQYSDIPRLKAHALLLEAGLAQHKQQLQKAIQKAQRALDIAKKEDDIGLQKAAYQQLYHSYELDKQYKAALTSLKNFTSLTTIEQQQLDLISEDAFRQQKEFIEQTLHLTGQQEELERTHNEYRKFQKITFTLFILCALLFIFLLRRGHVINLQKEELDELNRNLYTHSRSGLKNLRMLNAKLPASLEESSHKFERWHVGELIHQPLNDRLRFVMIDVPFLRNMYLQHGYQMGLKIENAFGEYLKENIISPARIYHFSDANLLYIEPNGEKATNPEVLFEMIQKLVSEFEPQRRLNRTVRVGIADYPFLPRAYTAINDKELVDLLLMSANTARALSMRDDSSQWVYLKAIENAPAASLATGDIRQACKQAISQGLIKIHSSFKDEEIIKEILYID